MLIKLLLFVCVSFNSSSSSSFCRKKDPTSVRRVVWENKVFVWFCVVKSQSTSLKIIVFVFKGVDFSFANRCFSLLSFVFSRRPPL